jgi:hypothetical protein
VQTGPTQIGDVVLNAATQIIVAADENSPARLPLSRLLPRPALQPGSRFARLLIFEIFKSLSFRDFGAPPAGFPHTAAR